MAHFDMSKLCFLLLSLHVTLAHSSKILFFVNGMSSYSHRASIQPLANKLAERGHQVTFLSPNDPSKFPNRHPFIEEICPDGMREFNQNVEKLLGKDALQSRVRTKHSNDVFANILDILRMGHEVCHLILTSPVFNKWLDKAGQYDLVIMDNSLNECAYGVAYFLKAKTILWSTFGSTVGWDTETFGISPELSWIPGFNSAYDGPTTFGDRLFNTFGALVAPLMYKMLHLPKIDRILRDSLDGRMKDMPEIYSLIQNTSLLFVNSHYSDMYPRSYSPMVVQVGGITLDETESGVKEPNSLPKDIEDFIEGGGKDGFIYISFGSIVKFPPKTKEDKKMLDPLIQEFFGAMKASSNLQFLWKWEGDPPEEKMENVLFRPWFPQIDVLAHPKICCFVTQGGTVSLQQAIRHGVPLIVFPVMADQDYNGKRVQTVGHGIKLELSGLTAADLRQAFSDIANNPSYAAKAKQLSVASRDRPMSSLDTAVWWTEYILRTEDTSHLKPGNVGQPMWLQMSLDVLLVLLIIILFLIFLILVIVRFVFKIIFKIVKFVLKGTAQKTKIS